MLLPGAILLLLLVTGFLFSFSGAILWKLGAVLVDTEPPQKADAIEVLGGDYFGNRILKACELVREGYAPKAIVTGGGTFYGKHESQLEIAFAGTCGCPADFFIPTGYPAVSTVDEVMHLLPELHRLGVHKLLLVTSPSHTARATRVFRRLAPDIEIHPIASRDANWNNGYWWKTRQGRKTWFFETAKGIADFLGI